MFLPIVLTVLAGLPPAYELDFGALPPAKSVPRYEYVLILSFEGEPDVKIPCLVGTRGPTEVANDTMECLKDPRWKLKRNGDRITIYGYDDVPILKVTVEGKGS